MAQVAAPSFFAHGPSQSKVPVRCLLGRPGDAKGGMGPAGVPSMSYLAGIPCLDPLELRAWDSLSHSAVRGDSQSHFPCHALLSYQRPTRSSLWEGKGAISILFHIHSSRAVSHRHEKPQKKHFLSLAAVSPKQGARKNVGENALDFRGQTKRAHAYTHTHTHTRTHTPTKGVQQRGKNKGQAQLLVGFVTLSK